MNKKKLIIFLIILLALGAAFYFWKGKSANSLAELDALAAQNSNLAEFVNKIKEVQGRVPESGKEGIYYLELGLAWKSLADRTLDKKHYQQALGVYEKGIEITNRRNTVFMNNAGNMAVYIENFEKAREYYEEAINLAPGEAEAYLRLTNLHAEYLHSDSKIVLAIFDQGIARMLNPEVLKQRKNMYLQSIDQAAAQ